MALVTNTIFLLQPEKKKSLGFGKILKKKESSNQPSGEKDHDKIAKDPQYLSAAKRYKPLIKIYMNILNVAFQDTTPKYIEKVLVKEVSILFSNDQILSDVRLTYFKVNQTLFTIFSFLSESEQRQKKFRSTWVQSWRNLVSRHTGTLIS